MYEKLEYFLGRNTSEIKRGLVMAGLDILNRYGLVAAWSEISQMLDTSNDIDAPQLLLDIDVIINQGLNNVLAQHQIQAEGQISIKIGRLEDTDGLRRLCNDLTVLRSG